MELFVIFSYEYFEKVLLSEIYIQNRLDDQGRKA